MCPSQLDGASSAPTLTARDREAFQLASSLCDTTLAMCHQVIERHGAQESLPISCTKALHWEQQLLQRLRQPLQQPSQNDLHSCLSQSIRAIEQQHLPALSRIEQDWLWTPKPE
jgi:hypothetical protein